MTRRFDLFIGIRLFGGPPRYTGRRGAVNARASTETLITCSPFAHFSPGPRSYLRDRVQAAGVFVVQAHQLELQTERRLQLLDVTDAVLERVRQSRVRAGLVSVQTRHTTTAILINEDEPLLHADLEDLLDRLAPRGHTYAHDDLARRADPAPDESRNGDAHCKAVILGSSETVAVVDGELQLGCWQRVFLVELDGPRRRRVCVTVMGA
jgi:secondary thiamine-phosphate synthase enzyme